MTRIWTIGLFAMALALPIGCSRNETKDAMKTGAEKVEQATQDVEATAKKAADEAEKAGDEAANAMDKGAGEATGTAGEATGATGEAGQEATAGGTPPVGAGPDAAARCRDLAAAKDWKAALDPCTQAHAQNPDDAEIDHALQQARAAAGE